MKKDSLLFRISCVMFGVSALSVLLSFLGDYKGSGAAVFFAVLTGVLFWGCLIIGIVFLIIVNSHRKSNQRIKSNVRYQSRRVGVISFFSNRIATVFDITMVIFFVLFMISMFVPVISQSVTLVLFAFLLCSVYMHSMFNGVNYKYIKSINEECSK